MRLHRVMASRSYLVNGHYCDGQATFSKRINRPQVILGLQRKMASILWFYFSLLHGFSSVKQLPDLSPRRNVAVITMDLCFPRTPHFWSQQGDICKYWNTRGSGASAFPFLSRGAQEHPKKRAWSTGRSKRSLSFVLGFPLGGLRLGLLCKAACTLCKLFPWRQLMLLCIALC